MCSAVDSSRQAAINTVYQQKLSFVTSLSREKDETEYSEISVGIFAPYGTYNYTTNTYDPKSSLGTISNKPSKGSKKSLPDHLAPLQQYLEAVMLESKDEQNMYSIDGKYFDILLKTQWSWKKEEFRARLFGHIAEYQDKLNFDVLSNELKYLFPYFYDVMKVIYLVVKGKIDYAYKKYPNSDLGYSLQEIY